MIKFNVGASFMVTIIIMVATVVNTIEIKQVKNPIAEKKLPTLALTIILLR